ncbi:MAG TPA: transcriptional repressor [Bdellovibrionales bacterium]|nr:transcriptional repressor [Bdellovibrionales bacterium]
MTACGITARLTEKGIRPTAHRVNIAKHVLATHCHFTAEDVCAWAQENLKKVSRATVYNTLNELSNAGLLRPLQTAESASVIFDSNTADHFHVYDSGTGQLLDIEPSLIHLERSLRDQYDIEKIEIIIRGRKKS